MHTQARSSEPSGVPEQATGPTQGAWSLVPPPAPPQVSEIAQPQAGETLTCQEPRGPLAAALQHLEGRVTIQQLPDQRLLSFTAEPPASA